MTRDWVLLRGLTREAGHWGALPRALEEALPGVRLHLLDLPGAGAHHRLRCPVSVADRKSTRLNSSHSQQSRMPSSA